VHIAVAVDALHVCVESECAVDDEVKLAERIALTVKVDWVIDCDSANGRVSAGSQCLAIGCGSQGI